MLIPEMVGFVLGVCAKVERDVRQGGANGYKVREFGEALDSIMIENRHESHILLHSILKVLDGLLISNPKLYNLTISEKTSSKLCNTLKNSFLRNLTWIHFQFSSAKHMFKLKLNTTSPKSSNS
jgi:hypothetical protein